MAQCHFTLFVGFIAVFCSIDGFNIDTKNAILKELDATDAYFGYSVAQHSIVNDISNPKKKFDQ